MGRQQKGECTGNWGDKEGNIIADGNEVRRRGYRGGGRSERGKGSKTGTYGVK